MTETSYIGWPMSATISLISPPGENFDLFVYLDPVADAERCEYPNNQSTEKVDRVDMTTVRWGETNYIPTALDESRTLIIEVRAVDACSPAKTWSLLVQGNK